MMVDLTEDELYVIEQMGKYLEDNPDRAASWVITAQGLYPKNFYIQVKFFHSKLIYHIYFYFLIARN